jgi:hypothetical protein
MRFWGKTLLTRHRIHDSKLVCRGKCIKVSKAAWRFCGFIIYQVECRFGSVGSYIYCLEKAVEE